jgi:pimeloyl-ACP methyl ester carboxylesterase
MSREEIMARGREQHPTWSEEEIGPWADAKQRVSRAFAGALRFPEQPDWRETLPRVSCPLLLITADPDLGAIVAPEAVDEARRLLPSIEVVRLDGAGHSVRREAYDAFLAAVRAFLAAP